MLDLIDRVGPGGEFMSAKETARRSRTEIWMPVLMDRQSWDGWKAAGAPAIVNRIWTKVQQILTDHQPPPLSESAAEKIEAILNAAEARRGSQGAAI